MKSGSSWCVDSTGASKGTQGTTTTPYVSNGAVAWGVDNTNALDGANDTSCN